MQIFSSRELKELSKAYIGVVIIFALLFYQQLGLSLALLVSAVAVGISFVVHELAHKFVAMHYNCIAEFRSDTKMLLVAFAILIISGLRFVIIAPGAVMIRNVRDRKHYGIISASGPMSNILLALVFLALSGLGPLFAYGFRINAILAFFNLLPFGMFDGKKILDWNRAAYAVMFIVALALFALRYL
ncbi:MAG: peptidase M50 [Nanoarchaeota archaeon]